MSELLTSSNPLQEALSELSYAYGAPLSKGVMRQCQEDFFVDEVLGFEPEGEGEHVFLQLEKRGLNTQYVADQLARFAKVAPRLVSFSGMKDRHAVTRQWFSVHLPGKHEPDWNSLHIDAVQLLQVRRHPRKLRRGAHRSNHFKLVFRDCDQPEDIARRAGLVQQGIPNYFGEQRFGHSYNNLRQAERWFGGHFTPRRQQRGLFLSAARSALFNVLLSERVSQGNWCLPLGEEVCMLEGSHSTFQQQAEDDLLNRLEAGDIHLTGPLYGKSGSTASNARALAPGESESEYSQKSTGCMANELEARVLSAFPEMLLGLENAGLKAERRALRVIPREFQYATEGDVFTVSFTLASGCFATALVRELLNYRDLSRQVSQSVSSRGNNDNK